MSIFSDKNSNLSLECMDKLNVYSKISKAIKI